MPTPVLDSEYGRRGVRSVEKQEQKQVTAIVNISQETAKESESTFPDLACVIDDLVTSLCIGMYEEFAAQFRRVLRKQANSDAGDLAALVNSRIRTGARSRHLRLSVSHSGDTGSKTVTVLGSSALFGSSWTVARVTFSV